MTTSFSASNASAEQSDFPQEKVHAIGWSFVRFYYELFSVRPHDVYKMYAPTARVVHDDLNEFLVDENPKLVNVEANGHEEIQTKIFNTAEAKNENTFKIMVTQADMQNLKLFKDCKTILISVLGEIAKGDSPAFNFTQTFILNPASGNPSSFDITNDIFRFIPLEDEKDDEDEQVQKERKASVDAEQTPKLANETVSESTAIEEEAKTTEEPLPATTELKPEVAKAPASACSDNVDSSVSSEPEKSEPSTVDDKKDDDSTAATSVANLSTAATSTVASPKKPSEPAFHKEATISAEKSKKSTTEEHLKTNGASGVKQPTSWAARAAKKGALEAPQHTRKSASGPSSGKASPAAESSKISADSNAEGSVTIDKDGFDLVKGKKDKKAVKPAATKKAYQVYIRDVQQDVTETALAAKLEASFGKVQSCSIKQTVAFVTFKTAEARDSALNAGSLAVSGKCTISIKPRVKFRQPPKKFVNDKKNSGKFQNGAKVGDKN